MKKVTLIVSVYKKIHDLELVLTSLKVQSCKEFEVIIADDGSGENIQKFVKDFAKNSPYDIAIVTQEDRGFRKNAILNKAILKSSTPYLIFIDGDCIPHYDFIRHHIDYRQKNTVLCGRRINLSQKLAKEITIEGLLNKKFQKIKFKHFIDSFSNKADRSTYVEQGIILENKLLRKIFHGKKVHIVGCNFSLHKDLLEKINGFDENYIGPGIGEDSDIEYRLRLIKAKFHSLKNLAILFHLYHGITKEEENNSEYFKQVQIKGKAICKNGLVKLN